LAAAEKVPGIIDVLYIGPDDDQAAIEFMRRLARLGWEDTDGKPSLLRVIHERLCRVAIAMEAEIRKQYGMPARD